MVCYQWSKQHRLWWKNEDGTTVKFETKVIKANLFDYSDAYVLVTGDITATGGDADTKLRLRIGFHLLNV